jgi:hypothetical protein
MPTLLHPTDEVFCPHCRRWHAVEQRNTVSSTLYDQSMLYINCDSGLYFVGSVGRPSDLLTRRPPIWTLQKGRRLIECCLRSEGEGGWRLELYRNGAVYASRLFTLHADAVTHAEQARGDCELEGRRA